MTGGSLARRLRPGLAVRGSDGPQVGEIAEVYLGVGTGEAWGAVGAIPMEGARSADPAQYAYSEAMPGEGSDYVRVARSAGGDLYVPVGAFAEVREGAAVLAITAEAVPAMQWDVLPDFVNVRSIPDSGAESTQA